MKIQHWCSFILLLTATAICFSQVSDIEWQNTIGGNNEDRFTAIHQNSDGGYIISGYSMSGISGDKSEARIGTEWNDYWIVRLDGAGNIMWENTIGGSSEDICYDVRQTPDGGFIVVGQSSSGIGYDKAKPAHGGDFWIIKLTPDGNIDWQKTIGSHYGDAGLCMDLTSDGGYIFGGNSSGNATGNKTEMCRGKDDYWIVKTDASGNILWDKTFGGSEFDWLYNIRQTPDGGYILSGISDSPISGDKTAGCEGGDNNWDCWVIKTDANGNMLWQNTIGGNYNDLPYGFDLTADGGYILGMESSSPVSGDKTEGALGLGADYWIVKLNSTGNIEWQNTIGGSNGEYLGAVKQTPDGGYIVGGGSSSPADVDKTIPNIAGTMDYWLVKLDATGNISWQKVIGGTGGEAMQFGQCIDLTSDGGFIIGGYSNSGISGDKTEPNLGGIYYGDYWIIKLTPEICTAPGGLFANNITSTKATLHWDEITGVDTWQVWFRESGGGLWTKKNATDNFKTIKALSPSTTYEYKVRTKCGATYSEFSETNTFTTLPFREVGNNYDITNNQITIYPNPANYEIKVSVNGLITPNSSLIITDLTGKIVYQNELPSAETTIDVSNYAAGIYFVKGNIDDALISEKFIKE